MYEAKDPQAKGICLPGGMWQCPACGGKEKGESRLRMRHGFSSVNHSGYWWINYGACMVMRTTLIELGWEPPRSYKRRDMIERGHVFTANEEDQIAYAFRRGGWLHGWVNGGTSVSPENVGDEVADTMTPLIMGRLYDKMLGEVPLDELEDRVAATQVRIHESIRSRVSTSVARVMDEYEQQGVAFGTGESLNRALNALVEQYAHVETPTEDEGLTHIVCWLRPDEPPTRDGYTRMARCGWDVSGHRMITRGEPRITCRVCEDLEPHHAGCSPQAGCLVK